MNARIQIKQGPHEDCIGTQTFKKENVTLEKQSEEIEDDRLRFMNLCVGNNPMIMNTTFRKPDNKLTTWKTPDTRNFTFMSRPNFEMIDYHFTQTRWTKHSQTHRDRHICQHHIGPLSPMFYNTNKVTSYYKTTSGQAQVRKVQRPAEIRLQ